MGGAVPPDLIAESGVMVNGGFEPCRDDVAPGCEEGWQGSNNGDPFCLKVRYMIQSNGLYMNQLCLKLI